MDEPPFADASVADSADGAEAATDPQTVREAPMRHRELVFAACAVCALMIVLAAAVTRSVPLRYLAHAGLALLLILGVVPLLLLLSALVALVLALGATLIRVVSTAPGIDGGRAEAMSVRGFALFSYRYSWFLKRVRTIFYGTALGLFMGSGVLYLYLKSYVVRESHTEVVFSNIHQALDLSINRSGTLPRPDTDNYLVLAALPTKIQHQGTSPVAVDGFGRPITYVLEPYTDMFSASVTVGSRTLDLKNAFGDRIRYRLTSLGYDGRPSDDDSELVGSPLRVTRGQTEDGAVVPVKEATNRM